MKIKKISDRKIGKMGIRKLLAGMANPRYSATTREIMASEYLIKKYLRRR
jgi:hypothetical protein